MNSAQMVVRQATTLDAKLIAAFGARTFKAAFGADNSAEDMQKYLAESFSEARVYEQLNDPRSKFLLGYEGETLVGYVMLRAGEAPAAVTGPNPVELVRIYVDVGKIGHGYGSAMMHTTLEQAQKDGYKTVWLGVWWENSRAIEFYRRWGFEQMGTKKFVLGSDEQTDLIMQRAVGSGEGTGLRQRC